MGMTYIHTTTSVSEKNGLISWGIRIEKMSNELLIGFTDTKYPHYAGCALSDKRMYWYSDGSKYTGLWSKGKHVSKKAQRYRAGDFIGIKIDFETYMAAFYWNGIEQGKLDI